ncbi:Phosphatidylinositol mannoside acyltransferase [Mycobacterium simulans]|uniref:lysophospholipid acyltransferase family protein n=1 Tax=Mycobacterium simulans TaxID=627089 RepID=UPI0017482653|nr:lysophospholipid acyltransferase family protein [Mycobacterium simulans]SON60586.1 Phosphatidylinositol mannoside acyltransferase [Mycobacterium simulans]
MSEPSQPQVSLVARALTLLVSTFYRLLPARLTDAASAAMARLVYWKGHALHSGVLQDFRDNVDPTAQLSERQWRPVRAMYRALMRNAFDGIWFLTVSRAAALRRFRVSDTSPIAVALAAGRPSGVGAVVVFPHLGSYAALPVVLAINEVPTTVVANRQRGLMQWVITRGARKAGLELVVVDRARGASTTAELMAAIERGRVVAIAGDYFRSREGGGKGIEVDLAGTRRTVGPGPALLSPRTGAAIVPAVVFQHGHRREPVLGQPIYAGGPLGRDDPNLDKLVPAISQRIADAMAQFIKREPEQWVMPGGLVSDSLGRRQNSRRDGKKAS